MTIIFWDGVLRGGAMALMLLLAANFARGGAITLTARLGLALVVSGLCYLFLPAAPFSFNDSPWRVPLHLAGMAAPGLFWLFAASWFDDDFDLRPVHGLAVAGLVLSGALTVYIAIPAGWPRFTLALTWPLPSLVLTGLGLVAALRGRDNDLVEARRRVRLALALVIGGLILVIVIAELLTKGWPPPAEARLVNSAALTVMMLFVSAVVFGWRDAALLAAPEKQGEPALVPEADDGPLLARLAAEMARERLYRQDGLTITAVAARLRVPEYRLRRAINRGLGARNFNAYLNGFRIAEVRAALADHSQREVPILTIALDAGFGSLAPFNRAFRAETGCTPTEYRARSIAT
jgi:AraC-like DNA-binding protein